MVQDNAIDASIISSLDSLRLALQRVAARTCRAKRDMRVTRLVVTVIAPSVYPCSRLCSTAPSEAVRSVVHACAVTSAADSSAPLATRSMRSTWSIIESLRRRNTDEVNVWTVEVGP